MRLQIPRGAGTVITIDDFNRALAATCTERQRVIVQLRYIQHETWDTIGQELNVNPSTALRDCRRAFEQVRSFLEKEEAAT
jgi:DNA-directed RNA polymerase specialized sigma24 family protein